MKIKEKFEDFKWEKGKTSGQNEKEENTNNGPQNTTLHRN